MSKMFRISYGVVGGSYGLFMGFNRFASAMKDATENNDSDEFRPHDGIISFSEGLVVGGASGILWPAVLSANIYHNYYLKEDIKYRNQIRY